MPRGVASPNVSLGKVLFEHRLHLLKELGIDRFQPFGYVLVDGGFAGAKLLGAGMDGAAIFYDIITFFFHSFDDGFPQSRKPPDRIYSIVWKR